MIQENFINPFIGLRSFEEDESHLFFGRERQISDILLNLKNTKFTSLIGYSGSGKSSLIKSGIIPAIKKGISLGEDANWNIRVLKPGVDPIQNLCDSISTFNFSEKVNQRDSKEISSEVKELLLNSGLSISECIKKIDPDYQENTLLIIDQFEELFSFCDVNISNRGAQEEASLFVRLFIDCINNSDNSIFFILTMRSDFLGRCTEFPGLPETLNKAQYLIPKLSKDQLKNVIKGPLEIINSKISDDLLDTLVSDFQKNKDQLPVLQHVMMRTLDYWNNTELDASQKIDISHYDAVGTMGMALSNHIDEAYNELDSDQKIVCEKLFKTLINFNNTNALVRQPSTFADIVNIIKFSREEVIEVIDVFRKDKRSFLTPDNSLVLSDSSVIDISHESLLRLWRKLNIWIKNERDSVNVYRELCEIALFHQQGKISLLVNPELQIYLNWVVSTNPSEDWGFRYDKSYTRAINYLNQSKEDFDHNIFVKEQEQIKKTKRTKAVLYLISCFLLISVFGAIYSFVQKNKADEASFEAEKQRVIAVGNEEEAKEQRILAVKSEKLAILSSEEAEKQKQIAFENAKKAQQQRKLAIKSERLAVKSEKLAIRNAQEAEKQKQMAFENAEKAMVQEALARKNEAKANSLKELAESTQDALLSIKSLNQDEKELGVSYALTAYDKFTKNSTKIRNSDVYLALYRSLIEGRNQKYYSHSSGLKSIKISPSDEQIALIDEKGKLLIGRANSADYILVESFQKELFFTDLVYTRNQESIVSVASSNQLYILLKGESIINTQPLINFESKITSISSSNIGSEDFITLIEGGRLHVYKIDKENLKELDLNIDFPVSETFVNRDFSSLMLISDNQIKYYELSYNDEVFGLGKTKEYQIEGEITSLNLSNNKEKIAVGYEDGLIEIIDVTDEGLVLSNSFNNHLSEISELRIVINKKESILISSSFDNTINITNLDDGTDFVKLKEHQSWINGMTLNAKENMIYTASEDRSVRAWFIYQKDIVEILNKK